MSDRIAAGTLVEIQSIVLEPGGRAPQVPEDTAQVPLEMRAKGILVADAAIGEDVLIETAAGRHLRGNLVRADPAYTHGFGQPIPELTRIGGEVRAILRERRRKG